MHAKRVTFSMLVLTGFTSIAVAAPPSGHTDWGPWRFDWVAGSQSAGLSIRNVRYENELVLYKSSMPVVRVQYAGDGCGPYADKLGESTLQPVSFCGNNTVCQRSFASGGRQWLELGILAKLGAYRMYQVYYFSNDGYIAPHIFSKGLQCNLNHDHHPYWRYDFDINGFSSDQVFVYDNNRPNQGWGPGWLKYTSELNDNKNSSTNRVWFVRDNPTGHGSWVLPGSADGSVNTFSNKDIGARRYHGAEDEGWPFGASGHLGYGNSESIQETDVILWYAAHMPHSAAEGSNVWHSVGPWLLVHR